MTTNRTPIKYGWKPQIPDHRDLLYQPAPTAKLPSQVDLSPQMPPIYDQGQLGSCTGNAVARVLEYEQIRQGEAPVTPSRLFIYYEERVIEGSVPSDDGAEIRDGIKVVASKGAPPESDWPYVTSQFAVQPPAQAYANALQHTAVQYHAIKNGPNAPFRNALAAGHPVVFGFSVPASFENDSWDPAKQALPLPSPNEGFIGGHAVVASGYDFTCKRFPFPAWQIENSWGPGWGMGGRFWMNYKFFDSLATDFWVIERTS